MHTTVHEPVEVVAVRSACVSAYRMRSVGSINWGVRDWAGLRFETVRDPETRRTTVTIHGASAESALRFFVWEKLGSPSRLDVVCKEG